MPVSEKPKLVRSVSEYIAYLDGLAEENKDLRFIFRGQSDARWDLVPTVQRRLQMRVEEINADPDMPDTKKVVGIEKERKELLDSEQQMLDEFKKEAVPYLGDFDRYSDDIEWLALAQHHYLPTRLLDWTYHAATALYFAVEGVVIPSNAGEQQSDSNIVMEDVGDKDKRCAVWIANYDDNYSVETVQSTTAGKWKKVNPKSRPFNIDQGGKGTVLFYDPPHVTKRLAAQRGCFTLHSSRYQVNYVEWPTEFKLKKIEIPYSCVISIKRTLRQLGNNGASLFPGLDGIALDIVSQHNLEKRHVDYPL